MFKTSRHYIYVLSHELPPLYINVRENRMDNPEKLSTLSTQDEDKQKHTTQYVLDTTMRKQTHIT